VLGWSFGLDGPAPALDLSRLPALPHLGPKPPSKVLYVVLPPGFILPVRKKPEVGEKRVYRISRKFFRFIVFLSDKNLEKKSSIYTKTT
jgi:hypothetical protein